MKKIASIFYSVMIFFTAQNSFGMDEIARNTDSTNIREIPNKKISFEELDNLHQRMKAGIPLKEYAERMHNIALGFYDHLLQRVKREGNEWFFIFIKDKDLRDKVVDILNKLLNDLVLSFIPTFGPLHKVMEVDRRREARLAEQNPRCIENLIIETCLMDLLEWAAKERDRNYFFLLKETFMTWMFDLQALEEEYGKDYDFQKQLENQKGFFHRLMNGFFKNKVHVNPNDIVVFG